MKEEKRLVNSDAVLLHNKMVINIRMTNNGDLGYAYICIDCKTSMAQETLIIMNSQWPFRNL